MIFEIAPNARSQNGLILVHVRQQKGLTGNSRAPEARARKLWRFWLIFLLKIHQKYPTLLLGLVVWIYIWIYNAVEVFNTNFEFITQMDFSQYKFWIYNAVHLSKIGPFQSNSWIHKSTPPLFNFAVPKPTSHIDPVTQDFRTLRNFHAYIRKVEVIAVILVPQSLPYLILGAF